MTLPGRASISPPVFGGGREPVASGDERFAALLRAAKDERSLRRGDDGQRERAPRSCAVPGQKRCERFHPARENLVADFAQIFVLTPEVEGHRSDGASLPRSPFFEVFGRGVEEAAQAPLDRSLRAEL